MTIVVLLMVALDIASAQLPQPIHFKVTVADTQLSSSRRNGVITRLSAGMKRLAKGEGIENSDLVLGGLRRNTTYSAIPDGGGWIELLPHDWSAGAESPGQANLVGEPSTQILVSFVLPERLYHEGDTDEAYVTTRFDATTASWGASGAEINYFDPRNPATISLDSMGTASIALGGIFEVGPTIDRGGYQGEASLTIFGDTIAQVIHFEVWVDTDLYSGIDSDLELTNLVPGRTYSGIPDGAGSLTLTPNDGIAAVTTSGQGGFLGDRNGHILVSFVLPQELYRTSGSGTGFVKVRFDSTSASWGLPGAETNHFDPREPVSATLNSDGYAIFALGGIFDVDSGITPGTYEGEALIIGQPVTSVVQHPDADYPKSFQLSQNYPNPFNPATTIRYQIPTSSNVKLGIFDIMGREVATLVKDSKAPGEYIAKWDASSYPSGVYYYRLEAGSYSEVKKLVLIR